MNNLFFEDLLNKNYQDINNIIDCHLRVKKHKEGYYINTEFINYSLYGMRSNFITLLADENKKIKSISIHFEELIDEDFYNKFIEVYGKPNKILVSKYHHYNESLKTQVVKRVMS